MQHPVPGNSSGRSVRRSGESELALVEIRAGLLIEPDYLIGDS